jgi:hypothetical protein
MKSTFFLSAALLSLVLLCCFCGKDDASQNTGEGPFFDFLSESSIQIDTVEQSADSWEYGFVFTPLKSGAITDFSIKMPATGDFTVTLWDLSAQTPQVIGSRSLNSGAQHVVSTLSIPEITLQKDAKYAITVRSNAFYRVTKAGGGAFVFPRTIGNIRIESYNEAVNNTGQPLFAITTNDTRVTPCVNVIFIAD